MGVRVKIFYPELRKQVANQSSVTVNGRTVGECLDDLVKRYPGAGKLIFNERGQLIGHVYVYVNFESAYKADLARPVSDRDELILAVLLTGG